MRRVFAAVAIVVPLVMTGWLTPRAAAQTGTPVTGPRGTVTGPAEPAGTAVMRGVVLAADTGAPLRRADVRAFGAGGRGTALATTDDNGRFDLTGLLAGRYTLMASKGGFVTLQYGQRRPAERGTPIDLGAGQVLEKLVLALPRGGVIAGRITDEFGEPAVGVQVQVLRYAFAPGGRRLQPAGRMDATDDQGSFRLYGLNPGDYYVSATLRSGLMMTMDGRPAPEGRQGYAPTYYPGTPSRADAGRITVGVGQEVGGISFALAPTRVARVSGRVVGLTGDRANAFVMARLDDGVGFGGGMQAGGQVDEDGEFHIASLPPGRYLLQVQPRGGREEDELVGLATVTVAGTDLSNVVIAMQRPGTIAGRIEFEGGTPATVRPSQVRVFPNAVDPASPRAFMSGPPQTRDDFTFVARGALGPVLLQPNAPPGWHLKSVTLDGEDITDTPIALVPGTNVTGVRVLLTQAVTTVSGSVRDARGDTVLDASIVVFPDDEAKWSVNTRHIRTARPDTEGRFEITGLPPAANYRIVAVQGLEDGQAYDPEFLASVRDRSDRLALTQGEAKAVELRLKQ